MPTDWMPTEQITLRRALMWMKKLMILTKKKCCFCRSNKEDKAGVLKDLKFYTFLHFDKGSQQNSDIYSNCKKTKQTFEYKNSYFIVMRKTFITTALNAPH